MSLNVSSDEGRLFQQLANELVCRQPRIERLAAYYRGDPPLPERLQALQGPARDFFRTSRTNFAELVAEAPRERMKPIGIRTSQTSADDEDGDNDAWALWNATNLPILAADVHQAMLSLGDGYVIVTFNEKTGRPVVCAEDPRQVVTMHDPETDEITAALKLYRDDMRKLDVAFMYRPGQVFVATKPATPGTRQTQLGFNVNDWDWDADRSGPLPAGFEDVMPVVRFRNRDGVGEFERHTDVIDRINRTVLRAMVIMTYQAFRQRAATGSFPERDDQGNLIDYETLFQSGPDALWLLPPDAHIWESGHVNLSPLQQFVKADVLYLAAVTRTPLSMLTPDAAQQSAEGASLQREGLVFKTEDRITRASQSWSKVVALMFRYLGDANRAQSESIQMMWAPVERFAISERANAIAQTRGVISRYQQLTEIWGMSPSHASQAMSELTADMVLDQQFAQAAAANAVPDAAPPGQ